MTSRDDDAWRAIVDNYGERPSLDDLGPENDPGRDDEPVGSPSPEPFVGPPEGVVVERGEEPDEVDEADFVPQPAPPLPPLPPLRRASWAAVLGVPVLMLLVAVAGWRPPTIISLVAVAGFVVGFGYLVATMSREPRDPWDNGAQV